MVRQVVYPAAHIVFDPAKPDGMPRKLLDVSKLAGLGWRYRIALRDGIEQSYAWFLEHHATARGVATPEGH